MSGSPAKDEIELALKSAWYKRHNEPADKYFWFQMYRNQPPGERDTLESIRAIAEAAGKKPRTVREWRKKYGWRERAAAYDLDKDRKTSAKIEELQLETLAKERDMLDPLFEHGRRMIAKATVMRAVSTTEIEEDGVIVQLVDRVLNVEQFERLVRAVDRLSLVMRRNTLMATALSAKHLESPYVQHAAPVRRVIREEVIMMDPDAIDIGFRNINAVEGEIIEETPLLEALE